MPLARPRVPPLLGALLLLAACTRPAARGEDSGTPVAPHAPAATAAPTATAATAAPTATAASAGGKPGAKGEGGMWNGGKPRAPVQVQVDRTGELPTDSATRLRVTVTPGRDCAALEVRVRGTDGVDAWLPSASPARLGCRGGEAVEVPVNVSVDSGRRGLLVVEARLVGGEEGADQTAAQSFAFRAPGTSASATLKPGAQGFLETGPDGGQVVVMPAEDRD